MRLLERFQGSEFRLTRVETFSDGVFAIVVTLLVLELQVPTLKDPHSAAELARQLLQQLPKFLSWLISFIIVCKFWISHHQLLELARHADHGMMWLNSLFLMSQAFVPFPTALLGRDYDNPLAVSFFGVALAVSTLLFIALQAYVTRWLLKPEIAQTPDLHRVLKPVLGPLAYLAGAVTAWISIEAAFALYLLAPLFFIVPRPRVR